MPRSKLTPSVKPLVKAAAPAASASAAPIHVHASTGFFDAMKMGVGMSVGQRLVSGIFGPPTANEPCKAYQTELEACLKREAPHGGCETRLTLYKECIEKHA